MGAGWSNRWTCSAAPVRAPFSGEVLGVVGLASGDDLATPSSPALVRATTVAARGEPARLDIARDPL